MKADIHPTYTHQAKVTCACGNTFTTGSTLEELKVEMCSNCHPFYTGKQKLIDTAGRVDRFKRIQERRTAVASARAEVAAKRKPRVKKPKVEKEEA